ncbi:MULTISPECIES: heavy-metal-associated domain-containing protein [Corynebacterium]|uniref:heavy-metal-associated domain-containing protein n=1 Tax=Corynebacterium TaxID=1716 RepID=UPI0008A8782D|nr:MULTISPECIES: cation transporter [Corynebacterium]MBC6762485.1 heavy metal transporter [Corynebacterium sp. LK27]MDK7110199.1 cation transporter [Corynebacterium amycolatum]MDK7145686.1 cation transporter [Corynebacterium amycolatum]OHR30778.1 heavy metal transporter [Corynebacterium sp. HMSC074C03]
MANQAFTVTGMTCGHCEASVREEVSELPGITDVQVDRSRNFLSVTSEADIDTAAVIAAVDEAGYKAVAN